MPFLIASIVIQVLLIVHVVKTGRNQIWIWILALFSVAGSIAYIAVEVLPGMMKSRAAGRAARGFKNALDPHADLRRYEGEARLTGNVASLQRYADELAQKGHYEEAIAQYRKALTGLYEHDAKLMLGLARAQFAAGNASAARTTLDDLIRHNPDFKSPAGHLLYARALEAEGSIEKAFEEYRALVRGYPGAEAAVRFAQLLKSQKRDAEAREVIRELLDSARLAPAHYQRTQKDWLTIARQIGAGYGLN